MSHQPSKSNEEIIKEFNNEHNDSVLGRYIIAYENAKTPFGISEKENKKADKEINKWLRTILEAKDAEDFDENLFRESSWYKAEKLMIVEEERERCIMAMARYLLEDPDTRVNADINISQARQALTPPEVSNE